MKYRLVKQAMLLTAFVVLNTLCRGQDKPAPAKNFIGISGNLVFNGFSGAIGIEYERYLFTKSRFALAVRAVRILKYKAGNLNPIYGADKNLTASHWQFWADACFFTSAAKGNNGFFINTGLGITYTEKKEKINGQPPMLIKNSGTMPAIEAGIGYPISLSDKLVLKLGGNGSVYFPSKNKSLGPGNMISLRIALGF
jgi:hypothetical protein